VNRFPILLTLPLNTLAAFSGGDVSRSGEPDLAAILHVADQSLYVRPSDA